MEEYNMIAEEVDTVVNEIFVDNYGNFEGLLEDIKSLVYCLLVESTEYLEELLELGEYYVDSENRVQKCIISRKDLVNPHTSSVTIDCPVCQTTIQVTI